jgi:uncharacterized membrane protein YdcZ (DUF606 family)
LFLLLAILAGTVVPIQGAVKSELRETVGRSITTAAISFLVGTFVLGTAVLLVRKQGRPGSLRRHRGAVMSLARSCSASSTLPLRYL